MSKNQQVGNIRSVISEDDLPLQGHSVNAPRKPPSVTHSAPFSEKIVIDPGSQLSPSVIDKFRSLHLKYDKVFDPNYTVLNKKITKKILQHPKVMTMG